MTKYKRMAVILAGEFRTWPKAAEYLFNLFDERAEQVDYYFVTWNVCTQQGELKSISDEDVLAPFRAHNKTPYKHMVIEPIGKHRTTFWNQAWLAKVGNLLKRRTEQAEDFVYDQVIETRPDIYLRRNPAVAWTPCIDFEYEGGRPVQGENSDGWGFLTMPDFYFRTNSFTNDIVANRYSFKKSKEHYTVTWHVGWQFYNHHWTITNYLIIKLLKPRVYEEGWPTRDYKYFCPIRPNVPADMNMDEQHEWEVLQPLFDSWGHPYNHLFYGPQSNEPIVDL